MAIDVNFADKLIKVIFAENAISGNKCKYRGWGVYDNAKFQLKVNK